MAKLSFPVRSLPGALTLACTAIGAMVVLGIVVVVLTPVVLGITFVAAWAVATLLLIWLGIEAMAALERWFERDPRFLR